MNVPARSIVAALGVSIACAHAAVALGSQPRLHTEPKATRADRQVAALVIARAAAMGEAFGALLADTTEDVRIRFVDENDAALGASMPGKYDHIRNEIVLRRKQFNGLGKPLPRWVSFYWTYYRKPEIRAYYPAVEVVDSVLWEAHLSEAAERRNLTWPHQACSGPELVQRLGCEMLIAGIYEAVHSPRAPIINSNRVDRFWPESLADLKRRPQPRDTPEYREVQRSGGILLVQPLIQEFGASRVLAYLAQTPFRIEGENVRLSALSYQKTAREALAR